jgi:hypothetical protein
MRFILPNMFFSISLRKMQSFVIISNFDLTFYFSLQEMTRKWEGQARSRVVNNGNSIKKVRVLLGGVFFR